MSPPPTRSWAFGLGLLGLTVAFAPEAEAADSVRVADATGEIVIDGVLDELDWQRAEPATDFLRYIPTDGGPPPGTTEVRFLQDETTLYIGMKVSDAGYPIRARISAREDINADDQIGVYLDPFDDGQSAYIFYLNPRGIQQDIRYSVNGSSFSWNAVFTTRGRVTDDGYVIEMALPYRSIRYPRETDQDQTWRVFLTRKIPAEGAKYAWPQRDRSSPRFMRDGASLEGVRPSPRGAGLELIPSLTVSQGQAPDPDTGEPTWQGLTPWNEAIRPSFDLRYGLSPNIGLTGTVNPDFSQVEVDTTPIALNQRFAFFFQERRPFFLDGVENYNDAIATLYSRSIVDPVFGMKVSGKEQGWSVGLLQALDRSPAASVHEDGAPGFDDVDGAMAADAMLRVAKDLEGGAVIGVTASDKRILQDEATDGDHQGVSADANIPLGNNWQVGALGAGSRTAGGGEMLLGGAVGGWLERTSGVGTGVNLSIFDYTPGFRQELGFLNQTGITQMDASVNHTFEPKGAIDTLQPGVGAYWNPEREGDDRRGAYVWQDVQAGGIHYFGVGASYTDIIEQGVEVEGWETWGYYEAELSNWLTLSPFASVGRTVDFARLVPTDFFGATADITLRPTPGIRLDLSLNHQRNQPEDNGLETAWRERMRLQWQFTQAWGLRVIEETTHGSERDTSLISSVLLQYLPHPGTALYVGYAEQTGLEPDVALVQRTVFAKGTFLIRM